MMPLVAETLGARLTEPLLHPITVVLDAAVNGSAVADAALMPALRVAWRLLSLLLAL